MNRYIQLLILSLISIFGLYLAFKGENLTEIIFHLSQINFGNIFIACVLLLLSCVVRAYRWQLLLKPFDFIPLKSVFSATMIGYFGNGVMAFRLGELLKSYSVSKGTKIKMMQAFGTVIIERTLDVIFVLIIFIFLIPWFPFEDEYIKYGTLVFSGIFLIIFFAIYLSFKYDLVKAFEQIKWFSSGFGLVVINGIKKFFEGIGILKDIESLWRIIISSFVIWLIYYAETIILVNACDINLNIVEIGILLVLASIAIGIPALPGSAGTYDAGVKYSLVFVFSISNYKALNYTIVSHSVALFPTLLIGFIYFIVGNVNFRELQKLELKQ